MAVGSVTSCCLSRWDTVIAHDHFLLPIGHFSCEANPIYCGQNAFHTYASEMQLLYYVPHKRGGKDEKKKNHSGAKNAVVPIITDLLKPEQQKSFFLLSLE